MPKCTADQIEFGRLGRRIIEANFNGGDISSDGGLMLLRRVDKRIGLTRAAAAVLDDERDPDRITHSLKDMMKTKHGVYMKHQMHHARDLLVEYEVDPIGRTVRVEVEWIDTALIESFLKFNLLHSINDELERMGKALNLQNLNGFDVELVVAGKSQFDLRLFERDFEPREPTLVMRLKGCA